MACILRPECNFLHGYFRYLLSMETGDAEVKVKMMRGIHMFRRDRTTQVILCNPWSTRLYPYPSLIRKMKTYLELEGMLGPKPKPQPQTQLQPCTSTPSHNNSLTRKNLVPKMAKKKRRAGAPVKRRYKVRIITHSLPTTPTSTSPMNQIPPAAPAPTVASSATTTQMPIVKSVATSILVSVYNLVQGKFEGIPYPTGRSQVEENPSIPSCNPPQQRPQPEAVPNTPNFQVREDILWPNTIPASTNLFETRQIGQFPLCKHLQWK